MQCPHCNSSLDLSEISSSLFSKYVVCFYCDRVVYIIGGKTTQKQIKIEKRKEKEAKLEDTIILR